jgi:hypothetical protein
MRQGQQNRRGRGRGRKPQNPLARNYESNGPDVKIRGTAAHIAEKYMSLARDALASGDMVTGESYLQHAEHYNRIIMAAQTQMGVPAGDQPNGGGRQRANPESGEEQGAEQPQRETADASSGGTDRSQGRGRGRPRGGNGAEGVHDANGAEPIEAGAADEGKSAPDPVS